MDLFLGPNRERWAPDSWQQLSDAAADGTLNETQWVELKKDLPPKAANSNLELARDLAGLALEGGLLVVGVSERKGPGGVGVADAVVGVSNAGVVADRVRQVALNSITPPLVVTPVTLLAPDGSGGASADEDQERGCVLVPIPASSEAPHMVDERYWGRSSSGKRPLHEYEVRQLIERSARQRGSFDTLLGERIAAAGAPFAIPASSWHLLAIPRSSRPDMLTKLLYETSGALRQMVWASRDRQDDRSPSDSPWRFAGEVETTRVRAVQLTNYAEPLQELRSDVNYNRLVVGDDLSVHVAVTGIATPVGSEQLLAVEAPVHLTTQALDLLADLSKSSRYGSTWDIAVSMVGISGSSPCLNGNQRSWGRGRPVMAEDYRHLPSRSTTELLTVPDAIRERLLLPFLRAAGYPQFLGS